MDDVYLIAALYGEAIALGHIFNDGNKRLMSMSDFLALNGYILIPDMDDAVETMVKVADKQVSRKDLAIWLKENSEKIE